MPKIYTTVLHTSCTVIISLSITFRINNIWNRYHPLRMTNQGFRFSGVLTLRLRSIENPHPSTSSGQDFSRGLLINSRARNGAPGLFHT